jgi:hypothetical protein
MSLIINKVSSSSIQINYSFLDTDILFGYEVNATYKIDFSDITYTNEQNVLFEGINALREVYQRKNIVARIGGDAFINARIVSQDFEESSLVGNSSCNIVLQESRRLDSLPGFDYKTQEFTSSIPSPQYVESFQETFSFSRNADNYSSSRNLSIKWKQDAGSQFLNNAKLFLREFYRNVRPNLGYQTDGISENARFNKNFRPLVTETIDLLNLSVSLQENVTTSLVESDYYSKRQTYSVSITEAGYTEKKYNVEIKALKEPLESQAETACKEVVNEIISENSSFAKPIEISKVLNKDGGIITLDISFSNDPSLTESQTRTYTVSKTKRGYFFDYEISVEITAEGKNQLEKVQNSKTYWTQQLSQYKNIITTFFSEASAIFELSRSTTFESVTGKIIDTVVFSDDDSYNAPNGLLKLKFTNNLNDKVDRISVFVDVVDKKQKIQLTEKGLQSKGGGSYTMEAVAYKSKGLYYAYDILKGKSLSVGGGTTYITSDAITIDSEGATNRVISYDLI